MKREKGKEDKKEKKTIEILLSCIILVLFSNYWQHYGCKHSIDQAELYKKFGVSFIFILISILTLT